MLFFSHLVQSHSTFRLSLVRLLWRFRKPKINNVEYFRKIIPIFFFFARFFLLSFSTIFCPVFMLFWFALIFNVNLQLFIVKVKPSIKFIDWDFGALSLTLWQSQLLVNYQNENFKLNFVHLLSMKRSTKR